jgi:H+/Cl- antiporter ClcA
VHDSSLLVQLGAAWIVAAIIGGIAGLVEVALATELMARNPQRGSSSD